MLHCNSWTTLKLSAVFIIFTLSNTSAHAEEAPSLEALGYPGIAFSPDEDAALLRALTNDPNTLPTPEAIQQTSSTQPPSTASYSQPDAETKSFDPDVPKLEKGSSLETVTLQEMGYPGSTLTPIEKTSEFWYEIPGNWDLTNGAYWELLYSFPVSHLTNHQGRIHVTVNGQRLQTIPLSATGEVMGRLIVPLPALKPTPSGYHLKITYDPWTQDGTCDQPDERAVHIHSRSSLNIAWRYRPSKGVLSEFPYPIIYPRARRPIGVLMVLPPKPTPIEYDTAAAIAMIFGRHAEGSKLSFEATTLDQLDADDQRLSVRHLVLVGLKDAWPEEPPERFATLLKNAQPTPSSPAWLATQTIERKGIPPQGILLISGYDAVGLALAAQSLAVTPDRLRGRQTAFSKLPNHNPTAEIWQDGVATFKQLELGDLVIEGVGYLERQFYLKRPRGWNIGEEAHMQLHISPSAILGPGSNLTVEINDRFAGVVPLMGGKNKIHKVPFPDSAKLTRNPDGTPNDWLVLKLKLEHKLTDQEQEDCDPRAHNAWTTLKADSLFDLNAKPLPWPDLSLAPYPLVQADDQNDVTFILTSELHDLTLSTALTMAVGFGRASAGTLPPVHIRPRETSQNAVANHHVVLLGYNPNDHWGELLSAGPNPFNPARPKPSIDNPRIGSTVGQIVSMPAPWQPERAVLILEANPRNWPTMSQSLQRPMPATDRVLVTSQALLLEGESVEESSSAMAWIGALLDWFKSLELSRLETILIVANFVLLNLWRRTAKQLDLAPEVDM